MSGMYVRIVRTATATVMLVVAAASPAAAATSDIGKHLGSEIKSWATTLLLGIAALIAIPILAKRDMNGGVVLAMLVLLVGGFAFAPDSVKHAIESLWHSIVG